MTVWLDGRLCDASRPLIDAADRGLLVADGAFASLLLIDGRPVFFAEHLERLDAALEALRIERRYAGDALTRALADVARVDGLGAGRAAGRITITRGPGPRGLAPSATAPPTVIVSVHSPPEVSPDPIPAHVVSIRRNEHTPTSRLKTIAYTDAILATLEARSAGATEAVLLNSAGRVACASTANLLTVRSGAVTTPPPSEGCRPGVARAVLMALAPRLGLTVRERPMAPAELEEGLLFASNALRGPFRLSLPGAGIPSSADLAAFHRLVEAFEARVLEDRRDDQIGSSTGDRAR